MTTFKEFLQEAEEKFRFIGDKHTISVEVEYKRTDGSHERAPVSMNFTTVCRIKDENGFVYFKKSNVPRLLYVFKLSKDEFETNFIPEREYNRRFLNDLHDDLDEAVRADKKIFYAVKNFYVQDIHGGRKNVWNHDKLSYRGRWKLDKTFMLFKLHGFNVNYDIVIPEKYVGDFILSEREYKLHQRELQRRLDTDFLNSLHDDSLNESEDPDFVIFRPLRADWSFDTVSWDSLDEPLFSPISLTLNEVWIESQDDNYVIFRSPIRNGEVWYRSKRDEFYSNTCTKAEWKKRWLDSLHDDTE